MKKSQVKKKVINNKSKNSNKATNNNKSTNKTSNNNNTAKKNTANKARKSKRKQNGGGNTDAPQNKDLRDMNLKDLDDIKQTYTQRGKSIGGAFSNFKFSIAGQNPVRPAPTPPECSIM